MSTDSHMTDICTEVVRSIRSNQRMFSERGMEAKLWGHVFSAINPHMFLDPWQLYKQMPDVVNDFVAMWASEASGVKAEEILPTPNPLPEDIFGLILQGRDAAPKLFEDPEMEPKLFAYCLNATRPHSQAHGKTMHGALPTVLQEFIELWRPTFDLLPTGLKEITKDEGEVTPVQPVASYGKKRR